MNATRAVPLRTLIVSLASGGVAIRIACGRMMRRNARRRGILIAAAASHWPLSIARIDARRISDAYADSFRVNAAIAAIIGVTTVWLLIDINACPNGTPMVRCG